MAIGNPLGIAVHAFDPLFDPSGPTYTFRQSLVSDHLQDYALGYQQEILAQGGIWSARLDLALSREEASNWFNRGINRHIEVYDSRLITVGQFFVDSIRIRQGALTAMIGPLMEVANRISVVYTPILDATTSPPITGSESVTAIADDAYSQRLYGILEEVLQGGEQLDDGTTDNAVKLRDTALEELRAPKTTGDLALADVGTFSVELNLKGYGQRLSKYVVTQTTLGTTTLSTKIQDALADDPNDIYSTDYNHIAANAWLAQRHEDDSRYAKTMIDDITALGDVNDTPYFFGIYRDQIAKYFAEPSTIEYEYDLLDNTRAVRLYATEEPLPAWSVFPGKWLFIKNFQAYKKDVDDFRTDPRYMFIQSVQITAPNDVLLQGTRSGRLAQLLAKGS